MKKIKSMPVIIALSLLLTNTPCSFSINSQTQPLLNKNQTGFFSRIFDSSPELTSDMSISEASVPTGTLQQGKFFIIKGVISSNLSISKVWGGVCTKDGKPTKQYIEDVPDSNTYDLSKYFDNNLLFDQLVPGDYIYVINAKDTSGKEYLLCYSDFKIGQLENDCSIYGENISMPADQHIFGKGFSIYGTGYSNTPIRRVTGGVFDLNWNGIENAYVDYRPAGSDNEIDLHQFDDEILFNKIPAGKYYYAWWIYDSTGECEMVANKEFSVVNPNNPTDPVITTTPTPATSDHVITTTPVPVTSDPVITTTPASVTSDPVITTTPAPVTSDPVVTTTPIQVTTTPDVSDPDTKQYSAGDVNRDGQINSTDACIILQYSVEMYTLDSKQLSLADVNNDGNVSTSDARLILQYIVGIIDKF